MSHGEIQDEGFVESFDWTDARCPSNAIINAVSRTSGDDPTANVPLYESIDPDALDALFARTGRSQTPSETSVEFSYDGYRILVKENGMGYVYDAGEV